MPAGGMGQNAAKDDSAVFDLEQPFEGKPPRPELAAGGRIQLAPLTTTQGRGPARRATERWLPPRPSPV